MEPTVRVERQGAIAVLTLDNPRQRNALAGPLRPALVRAVAETTADEGVRAVVLTGAAGTFCAGGDVTVFDSMTPMRGRNLVQGQRDFLHPLIKGEKPVIAAVEGFAYGAGFGLAMAADHVVAAKDAKFCASFNKIGLMPDGALLWTLPQRVGMGKAREMLMLATVADGAEGKRLGLVDTLAEPGQAVALAMEKAEAFAKAAPLAVAMVKAAFAKWPWSLDELLTLEAEGQAILFNTEDCKGAAQAFLAKRKPVFEGR